MTIVQMNSKTAFVPAHQSFKALKKFPVFAFAKPGRATLAAKAFKKSHHFCDVTFKDAIDTLSHLNHAQIKRIIEQVGQEGIQSPVYEKYVFVTHHMNYGTKNYKIDQIVGFARYCLANKKTVYTGNSLVFDVMTDVGVKVFLRKDRNIVLDRGAEHVFICNPGQNHYSKLMLASLFSGHRISIYV